MRGEEKATEWWLNNIMLLFLTVLGGLQIVNILIYEDYTDFKCIKSWLKWMGGEEVFGG